MAKLKWSLPIGPQHKHIWYRGTVLHIGEIIVVYDILYYVGSTYFPSVRVLNSDIKYRYSINLGCGHLKRCTRWSMPTMTTTAMRFQARLCATSKIQQLTNNISLERGPRGEWGVLGPFTPRTPFKGNCVNLLPQNSKFGLPWFQRIPCRPSVGCSARRLVGAWEHEQSWCCKVCWQAPVEGDFDIYPRSNTAMGQSSNSGPLALYGMMCLSSKKWIVFQKTVFWQAGIVRILLLGDAFEIPSRTFAGKLQRMPPTKSRTRVSIG